MTSKKTAKKTTRKAKRTRSLQAKALTQKERLFILEYIACGFNASEAARRVGCSAKRASTEGAAMLKRPHVKKSLDEAVDKRAERVELDAKLVLENLLPLIQSSVDDYEFDDQNGTVKAKEGAPESAIKALAAIKRRAFVDGSVQLEFKLWDKPRSLQLAMKHLGMLIEKQELELKGGVRVYIPENGR